MICPKCSAENPDEAEYCSLCFTRFHIGVRSAAVDEAADRMRETHQGSKLRCPSCAELSPLQSQFCLRCGFVFEDLESLMVSGEEIGRIEREAREILERETVAKALEAVTITPESDGAEVMRSLHAHLAKGMKPRIHASGRNAVTYAMKIVALLGEDMRAGGNSLRFSVNLMGESSVTHLDDVELEIVLEAV